MPDTPSAAAMRAVKIMPRLPALMVAIAFLLAGTSFLACVEHSKRIDRIEQHIGIDTDDARRDALRVRVLVQAAGSAMTDPLPPHREVRGRSEQK